MPAPEGTVRRGSSLRRSFVALGVAGLIVAGLPGFDAGAATAKTAAIGDRCLIGTWRDNGGRTTTRWLGHTVTMRTHGGGFDHITASGHDRNSWGTSKRLIGSFRGHRLVEQIRGENHLLLRAHGGTLVETEQGWAKRSSNRYLYRGKHSRGYLDQAGSFTFTLRCSLTTLTLIGPGGKVRGSETRVSFQP
jgi:hypothetical protein